jgi:excisionase family DNA binding protein
MGGIAMDRSKLYSIRDAAEFLGGISPWTIHSWLSHGRLQRVKVGARTMIRESELRKMIVEGSKHGCEQSSVVATFRRQFVKPSEAARQLNIPIQSVYALIRSGKMKAILDTGRWKIPSEEIKKWSERRGV